MIFDKLDRKGIAASVASAGFLTNDSAADTVMRDLVRPLGVDVSNHRSRIASADLVNAADLILTMERRHARELIVMSPDSAHRVHTLKGLITTLRISPPPSGTLEEQLVALGARRSFADLMGDNADDDVPDPHRRSKRRYRSAIEVIDGLTTDLAQWLATVDTQG